MNDLAQNKTKQNIAGISFLAAVLIITVGCWNEITWYQAMAPYGTLIAFVSLAVCFFALVPIKEALKDPVFYLMAAAALAAFINLILIHSNMGAILTICDLLLVLYLANKLVLNERLKLILAVYIGFHFFYWTFDVKGYFKGYNTNYGGLVLLTGFIFAFISCRYLKDFLIAKGHEKAAKYLYIWDIWMFIWGYNIISWYRARCALFGYLVFGLLLLLPAKLWQKKWLYALLCGGVTAGSVIFSWVYIWISSLGTDFSINLFYKEAISGREAIWAELWQEFIKHPITGIGSSYVMKLDWMEGMFEVHSGLLDILIVHGIFAFIVVCALLIKRLFALREDAIASPMGKIIMAGAMAMLSASFLENFFIVPPFTLCFMLLLCFASGKSQILG